MTYSTDYGIAAANPRHMVALVLGGGRGSRLRPLTAERAKPAVPLCGRYRLVDIPLSNCIHSGVNRIFVLTQFNSASLHRHINNSYKFDAFSDGFVELLAAEQTVESGDWFQGTADAVRQNLKHFRNLGAQHYLILAGDQLYHMDYRHLLATHVQKNADITVSAIPVCRHTAPSLGVLRVDDAGRITEFVEKPSTEQQLAKLRTPPGVFGDFGIPADGREYLASMGIYIIRAGVLEELLAREPDWIDFGKHVIPKSLKSLRVFAHLFSGFWEDIGTVRSYYEVSMKLVQPNPPFEFHDPDKIIYSRPRYLPGARLQDTLVTNSILCEGARIGQARIDNSIVGIRTIVNSGVTIERSILMGSDYYQHDADQDRLPLGIGAGSRISNAIIDKNARIGQNVTIRGADDLPDRAGEGYAVRDGIVIVLKNAVIPDGTTIG